MDGFPRKVELLTLDPVEERANLLPFAFGKRGRSVIPSAWGMNESFNRWVKPRRNCIDGPGEGAVQLLFTQEKLRRCLLKQVAATAAKSRAILLFPCRNMPPRTFLDTAGE